MPGPNVPATSSNSVPQVEVRPVNGGDHEMLPLGDNETWFDPAVRAIIDEMAWTNQGEL